MKNSLLKYLACPIDHHYPLDINEEIISDGANIEKGSLKCAKCDRLFPIMDGIPSFLPDELQNPSVDGENMSPEVKLRLQEMEFRNKEYKVEEYDSYLDSYSTNLELSSILKRLAVQPRELVMDAGCGNGRVTLEVAKVKEVEILAVDFSIDSLKILRGGLKQNEIKHVHPIHADLNYLPLRVNICDKVVSHGVFEHLPNLINDPKALEEVRRVMRSNSSLVMTVYNYSSIKAKITNLLPDFMNENKHLKEGLHADSIYYRRFTHSELEQLLKRLFFVEELTGLRNIHRSIGNKIGKPAMWIDQILEKSTLSHQTSFWLIAKCVKT